MSPVRQQIIDEAMTWLRTPWMHNQQLKGAGVDCGQFLISVFHKVGLVPAIQTGWYPKDWHLHRDEPVFMKWLTQYADETISPLPGDIAMFWYGRQSAHGSILLPEQKIIHAFMEERMVTITDLTVSPIRDRFWKCYKVKGVD